MNVIILDLCFKCFFEILFFVEIMPITYVVLGGTGKLLSELKDTA